MGIIVDSFAGGGGASTGIEMALGRSPDVAINHDPEAVALHAMNHPDTGHLNSNIWHVDPDDIVRRHGPVDLLWASPDCKHFSKAKGGKPVAKNIRDLAWIVVLWAKRARPKVIAETLGKAPRGGYWNTGMRILRDGGIIAETGPYELPAWLKYCDQ